jgi:hypothetical protein
LEARSDQRERTIEMTPAAGPSRPRSTSSSAKTIQAAPNSTVTARRAFRKNGTATARLDAVQPMSPHASVLPAARNTRWRMTTPATTTSATIPISRGHAAAGTLNACPTGCSAGTALASSSTTGCKPGQRVARSAGTRSRSAARPDGAAQFSTSTRMGGQAVPPNDHSTAIRDVCVAIPSKR